MQPLLQIVKPHYPTIYRRLFMYPILKTIIIGTSLIFCSEGFSADLSEGKPTNNYSRECSHLVKTISSFKAIINDIEHSYDALGGEMSSIRSPRTNIYEVHILQEERIDHLIYSLKFNENCDVEITDKKEETINPRI
jgi:hypothetical protein